MNKLIILVRGGSRLNFIDFNFFLVFLELLKKVIVYKVKIIFWINLVFSLFLIFIKLE